MPELSRRRGIIFLNEYDIKYLLGLDKDYQVITVFEDSKRMGIGVVVSGNDLSLVEPGVEPPVLDGKILHGGKWARE